MQTLLTIYNWFLQNIFLSELYNIEIFNPQYSHSVTFNYISVLLFEGGWIASYKIHLLLHPNLCDRRQWQWKDNGTCPYLFECLLSSLVGQHKSDCLLAYILGKPVVLPNLMPYIYWRGHENEQWGLQIHRCKSCQFFRLSRWGQVNDNTWILYVCFGDKAHWWCENLAS